MKIPRPLAGKEVLVRNYAAADMDFVTGMWFDEENGRYMSDPMEGFADDAYRKSLAGMQDDETGYYFVVERTGTGERIGSACAFPDAAGEVYDIGYCIHKAHWRNGYGSEAVSLLLQWLKGAGASAVTAEVAVDNAASCALLTKLGFAVWKHTEFKKYHMDIRYKSYIYRKEL